MWYVESLIHVLRWVGVELDSFILKLFFSGGKRNFVVRSVVVRVVHWTVFPLDEKIYEMMKRRIFQHH